MPACGSSLLAGSYVLVRVRCSVFIAGRLLHLHGRYGALYALDPHKALRLVENGRAKLPARSSLRKLREHCAELAGVDLVPAA